MTLGISSGAPHKHHEHSCKERKCSRLEDLVSAGVVGGSRKEARSYCQRNHSGHGHDGELAQPLRGAQPQVRALPYEPGFTCHEQLV